jgi:hypothetical protein
MSDAIGLMDRFVTGLERDRAENLARERMAQEQSLNF